jgi:hypothetical protein
MMVETFDASPFPVLSLFRARRSLFRARSFPVIE